MSKKWLNDKGLSLVEVIVSALIVSVLLVGIYAVHISAKNMIVLALHKAQALYWAQSLLEDEKHGIRPAPTSPATPNVLSDDKSGQPKTVTSTPSGLNSSLPLKLHIVTISWSE